MSYIKLNNVNVEFPIYSSSNRSLKNSLFKFATGGGISADKSGVIKVISLKNITLQLSKGDKVGLIGHNGSGKSTMLRTLSSVYQPITGNIDVKGDVSSLIDISLGIDQEATGRENIYLRGALLGVKKKEINRKINDIIDFSELGEFIELPVKTYSSGMQLRLAFAVSTIVRPKILIMDEWLSVGDENFRKKAEERMAEMLKGTDILVIASHSRDLIMNVCNRVVWLEHGEIKMEGSPSEICPHYFGY